jgi:hypothetical protein
MPMSEVKAVIVKLALHRFQVRMISASVKGAPATIQLNNNQSRSERNHIC